MATPVKIRATVRQVVRHGDSAASYRFTPHGRVPKFHAGQFMHLALDPYSPDRPWPESRVFSIASPASRRAVELEATVAVKGGYTRRILDTLEVGSECWLKLPYGEFLFPSDRPLTLVAGGVGITPFLSLLGRLLEEKPVQPVQLFYGVRSAPLYLFGDLIGRCRAALPGFTEDVYCEDGSLPGARRGVLDIGAAHGAARPGSLFFLSGPPAMIAAFRGRLRGLGVDEKRIRVDDWE